MIEIHTSDRGVISLHNSDIAWSAGFFEGEGTVSCSTRTHRYVQVAVVQADVEPLIRFLRGIGFGKVGNPQYRGRKKTVWRVVYNKFEEVQFIACLFWPWLSNRRRSQFDKALRTYLEYAQKLPTPKIQICEGLGHKVYRYMAPDGRYRLRCRDCRRLYDAARGVVL